MWQQKVESSHYLANISLKTTKSENNYCGSQKEFKAHLHATFSSKGEMFCSPIDAVL